MTVSVGVPVYNEVENLPLLHEQLCAVFDEVEWDAEVVFVNDGSSDGSAKVLSELAARDERLQVLTFARNFGQTAAMSAGIGAATGDVIVPMDADLQNDPEDIPRLIERLESGFDVVSGWRKNRQDKLISRRIPSRIANKLISWWTGVALHDYGCTLKAYRATVLKDVQLYGEMHRFIPVYSHWQGGKITEMVVNHRARKFGQSNYGLSRTFKVLIDLMTIKLLGPYSTKPAYLFGGLGFVSILAGVFTFLVAAVGPLFWGYWKHRFTFVLLASFLALVGVVMVMMGLLAELTVRIYDESQKKPTYILKQPSPDDDHTDDDTSKNPGGSA